MSDREDRFADDRLFYRVWETASPLALVVIAHGYAEHSGRYEQLGTELAGTGFATYALDHHGHGQSKGDERASIGSLEQAVADLDSLFDLATTELPDLPTFLIGHSMGGLIAAAYAEKHQDRLSGLVLSGAAVWVSPAIEAMRDMEEVPEMDLSPMVSRDPEIVRSYQTDPLVYRGPMPRALLNVLGGEVPLVQENLRAISIPVLLVHGGADALVPVEASEQIAAQVSSEDVTLRIWPDLYHEVFNEPERQEVFDVVLEWLGAHVPGGSPHTHQFEGA